MELGAILIPIGLRESFVIINQQGPYRSIAAQSAEVKASLRQAG